MVKVLQRLRGWSGDTRNGSRARWTRHRGERTSSHLFAELMPPATLLDGVKCTIANSVRKTPAVQERGTT